MHLIYVIINVLLLAGIIFLFGRKAIAGMFRTRRERINRELTEAETPFVPEPLPTPILRIPPLPTMIPTIPQPPRQTRSLRNRRCIITLLRTK